MGKKKVLPANAPEWITEELKISEPLYCWMFLIRKHPMRYIGDIDIIRDAEGNQIVLINDILFKGKRTITWSDVREYLKHYVGDI